MKSLKKLNLKGKKVVVRLDLDVPIDAKGNIKDDSRLQESIPTLKFLKKAKQIIIIGHLGRPKKVEDKFKLDKVAKRVSKLLGTNVKKLDDFVNIDVPKDKFIMLENLRFSDGEKSNDKSFSKQLASFGDVFVNDAFAVSHRNAASIVGITKFLPSYPGLKLESEVKNINLIVSKAKSPFVLVLGGAKLDKLNILNNLIKKSDAVLIGGAMMFTFLKALNYEIGKSKFEKDELALAKKLLSRKLILPLDVVLDNKKTVYVEKIPPSRAGFDIGPETVEIYSEILRNAKTIIWNGPMGKFEQKPFDKATIGIAKALSCCSCKSLVGGGDTIYSIKKYLNEFTHYSTAGGAFLELVSGKKLYGINALEQ